MPQQPAIIPLTDEEIAALANDPEAVKKFTSDERRRMSKIKPPSSPRRPQSEPDTYMGGVMKSVSDTTSRTAGGIGQGVLDAVNPMNYLQAATGPMRAVQDPGWAAQQGQNIIDMVRQLIQGNPETGGQMIGSLATGLAAPHILPPVADAVIGAKNRIVEPINAAGRIIERAGAAKSGVGGLAAQGTGKALQAVRPSMPQGFDRYLPNEPGPTPTAGPPEPPPAAPQPAAPAAASPSPVSPPTSGNPAQELLSRLSGSGALSADEATMVDAEVARTGLPRETVLEELAKLKASPPPTKNVRLTAPETKEFLNLQKKMSAKEAMAEIQLQRELMAKLNLSSPTVAQTKFPKGMRGGKAPLKPLE